jgi:hypothetical protein
MNVNRVSVRSGRFTMKNVLNAWLDLKYENGDPNDSILVAARGAAYF